MFEEKLTNKILGIIFGGAYGDAFGAPVELWSPDFIKKKLGNNIIKELIKTHKNDFIGQYTDDTEMVLATIKSINSKCGINYDDILKTFKEDYNSNRGYGFSTNQLLNNEINEKNNLSESNGGLMRISPIAIWNINSNDIELKDNIINILKLTSHHSEKSIDCCFLFSKIMIYCIKSTKINVNDFKEKLSDFIKNLSIENDIRRIINKSEFDNELDKISELEIYSTDSLETLMKVLNTIIYHFDKPKDAISYVVSYGGDTDTCAGLVGALMGSIYGFDYIKDDVHLIENFSKINEHSVAFSKNVYYKYKYLNEIGKIKDYINMY
jgi:ADP-ribosylglycohydrolase